MSKTARKKEEERIEKTIRNLLRLPENRRCINCTILGPQYVCTTFWTFVCTNCSGLHREFTHRVKSVSMAKFNAEEVGALQAGGNERARQIYFKEWDPQRHSFPDGSNQNRLRDFIKHAYVDRKFTGERNAKLAMVKADAEDPLGRQSMERPSYGGRTEDGSSKYYVDERRSPRCKPDNVKSSSHRNRPARFEIVDDRFRDDELGCGRRSGSTAEGRSPVARKSGEKTSPSAVRPVKDILGGNILPLQVGKSSEENNRKDDNSGQLEKPASLSDSGSVDAKPPEHKSEKSVSLIDLCADPEPPDPAAPQTPKTALSMVGAPASGTVDIMSEVPGNVDIPTAAPVVGDVHEIPPVGMELKPPSSSSDSMVKGNNGSLLTLTQQNQSYSPASGDISSTTQQMTPPAGASSDQIWTSSPAPNSQSSSSASNIEPFQPGSDVVQIITSKTGTQATSVEPKSSGRGELPADLFTACDPSFPASVQGWQLRPPHGLGFSMQYTSTDMPIQAFSGSAKSRNPFDLNDDNTQAQTPMPQVSPYQAMASTQLPTYGMFPVPGGFSGQQFPYGMSYSRPQEDNGVGRGQDPFASLSPIQQHSSGFPGPPTANSFPAAGGNPFG